MKSKTRGFTSIEEFEKARQDLIGVKRNGEGTKLADAYVQIIPISEGITGRIKDLFKDLPDEGDKAGDKTGSSFASKLKKAVAAAGVGAAISKVVTSAFTEGAALEQSLGGVETLFKKHADIVKKNAQDAYKTAGVSANEYMENVTSFFCVVAFHLLAVTLKRLQMSPTLLWWICPTTPTNSARICSLYKTLIKVSQSRTTQCLTTSSLATVEQSLKWNGSCRTLKSSAALNTTLIT